MSGALTPERSTEWRITSHRHITSHYITSHHPPPHALTPRRASLSNGRTYTWLDAYIVHAAVECAECGACALVRLAVCVRVRVRPACAVAMAH